MNASRKGACHSCRTAVILTTEAHVERLQIRKRAHEQTRPCQQQQRNRNLGNHQHLAQTESQARTRAPLACSRFPERSHHLNARRLKSGLSPAPPLDRPRRCRRRDSDHRERNVADEHRPPGGPPSRPAAGLPRFAECIWRWRGRGWFRPAPCGGSGRRGRLARAKITCCSLCRHSTIYLVDCLRSRAAGAAGAAGRGCRFRRSVPHPRTDSWPRGRGRVGPPVSSYRPLAVMSDCTEPT